MPNMFRNLFTFLRSSTKFKLDKYKKMHTQVYHTQNVNKKSKRESLKWEPHIQSNFNNHDRLSTETSRVRKTMEQYL